MYKEILVAVDNSSYSDWAFDAAFELAGKFGSRITCCHVYAARMHQLRFKQMERWLPPKYRAQDELAKQRVLHADLIDRGLRMISESYLGRFEKRCEVAGVGLRKLTIEGKNFVELVREINEGDYNLAVVGAIGLGATGGSPVGSVCERVTRRARKDLLIVRNGNCFGGDILVGVDGSSFSSGAVEAAAALCGAFGGEIEAVSAYDPFYHYMAFSSLKKVLTEKAHMNFQFAGQERLHQEVIDRGLADIYTEHLRRAEELAACCGQKIRVSLLAGKPCERIAERAQETGVSLIAVGRYGVHRCDGLDLGGTAENLMRSAASSVLICCRQPQSATAAQHAERFFQ